MEGYQFRIFGKLPRNENKGTEMYFPKITDMEKNRGAFRYDFEHVSLKVIFHMNILQF